MKTLAIEEEQILRQEMANGSETAFEKIFKLYYASLTGYAFNILKDKDLAEGTAQEIFVKFWEKRNEINIEQSIKAYLFRAIFNKCLNIKKHQEVKSNYRSEVLHVSNEETDGEMTNWELKEKIAEALSQLPKQCGIIFKMAKVEGYKYQEIADELNISVKTVENQMGKALKLMRKYLHEFLVFIISLIIFYD